MISRVWSETMKTGFVMTRPISNIHIAMCQSAYQLTKDIHLQYYIKKTNVSTSFQTYPPIRRLGFGNLIFFLQKVLSYSLGTIIV